MVSQIKASVRPGFLKFSVPTQVPRTATGHPHRLSTSCHLQVQYVGTAGSSLDPSGSLASFVLSLVTNPSGASLSLDEADPPELKPNPTVLAPQSKPQQLLKPSVFAHSPDGIGKVHGSKRNLVLL